jgi:two-component system, NarL family, nitrate/nitrite response regulator NarL
MISQAPFASFLRVFVVSDVRIYREGLSLALTGAGGFDVVTIAGSDPNLLPSIEGARPDAVIVDLSASGMGLIRRIRTELPQLRVVAFGVDDNEQDILACAETGVAGYVCREASSEELADNLRSAIRDEIVCSPKIAASLFRRLASLAGRATAGDDRLTIRERQVLALIRDGLANKQIAAELSIAEATVKNHVHNLLEKLHVKRRAQAASLPAARHRAG